MKSLFILAFLFTLSAALTVQTINLGEKVSFDSSNKEFALTDKVPNNNILLVLVDHEEGKKLGYRFSSYYDTTYGKGFLDKEIFILWDFKVGPCEFEFILKDEDKGSFIIYDFKTVLETKLRNKYGYKSKNVKSYIYGTNYDESLSQISFSVPNFRTNANIHFEFNDIILNYTRFANPFEVCHNDICKNNVTKYYFEKGESYQINVKIQKVELYGQPIYAIPGFTFYPEDYDGTYHDDDIEYDHENN